MTKTLAYTLICISLLAVPGLSQAGVNIDVEVGPPPARVEAPPPARMGYVWAPGYWTWEGHRRVWMEGRWMAERRGWHWVPERWVEHHHRWHLEPGIGSGDETTTVGPS